MDITELKGILFKDLIKIIKHENNK